MTWLKKTYLPTYIDIDIDIWDTDYNTDNWEPEFMTIFVIWQLIVTLDSIRNSCDVLLKLTFSARSNPIDEMSSEF